MFVFVLCKLKALGCVTLHVWVAVQPFASLTVTVYNPALKPFT